MDVDNHKLSDRIDARLNRAASAIRDEGRFYCDGKIARFSGDMCIDGFAAIANSMKWLPPDENLPVTEKERLLVMNAIREEVKNNKYKVFFTNDKYEDIDFS